MCPRNPYAFEIFLAKFTDVAMEIFIARAISHTHDFHFRYFSFF